MPTATLEDYLASITVIEGEFGTQWLQRKAKAIKRPEQKGWHPIPIAWKNVKESLEEFSKVGIIRPTQPLIYLTSLARDLSLARSLPNYHIAVHPHRLKHWREYPKAEYEVYIAALCLRSGHQVEFIPRSNIPGVGTPDLKLLFNNDEVYVECVRKDLDLPQKSFGNTGWKYLESEIADLLNGVAAGHEIIIIGLGDLQEKSVPEILCAVKGHILGGREGVWISQDLGCGLAIRTLRQPKPEEGVSLFLPAGLNPAFTFGTVAVDEQGRKYLRNVNRIALYVIKSHRLQSVLNTFGGKRQKKQIPQRGLGIVYLDLDIKHVVETDVPTYLELIAAILQTCFTPTANSRIGAIVLTTTPLFIETEQGGGPYINFRKYIRVIRNPLTFLPDGFIIPGENL